jgi:hypothetical protein
MTSAVGRADHAPGVNSPEIEPDQKDWTWVLHQPCPDCAFNAGSLAGPQVAARLRQNAARWPTVCSRAESRVRPEPGVWSPLEYACQGRDVCRAFEARANLSVPRCFRLLRVGTRTKRRSPLRAAPKSRKSSAVSSWRQLRLLRPPSTRWAMATGSALVDVPTAPYSPWKPSVSTSCMTSPITVTTCTAN